MSVATEKRCSKCGETKPLGEYYSERRAPDGKRAQCKACHRLQVTSYRDSDPARTRKRAKAYYRKNKVALNAYSRSYREDNRESIKEQKKGYFRDNKTAFRERALRQKYGMTLDDYDGMLAEQGGCCAICGADNSRTKNSEYFAVDHCHKTGKVRALLCHPCNGGIGLLQDDPAVLEAAIAYLRSHE